MAVLAGLLALAGIALIIYGLAAIYTPAAIIASGILLVWIASVVIEEAD